MNLLNILYGLEEIEIFSFEAIVCKYFMACGVKTRKEFVEILQPLKIPEEKKIKLSEMWKELQKDKEELRNIPLIWGKIDV